VHPVLRQASAIAAWTVLLTGCGQAPGESEPGAPAPAAASALRGEEPAGARPRPDFVLTAADGSSYDFRQRTAGRPTVLFFGYTSCPDVCPTTMADLAAGLRSLDPNVADQVQVVFVTTDPARDTPAVLADYLARFDTRFLGLTGSAEQVAAAQTAAGVPLAEEVPERAGHAHGHAEPHLSGDYLVAHGSTLTAYGSDDTEVVSWRAGTLPEDYAADLSVIVEEDR